MTCHHSQYRAMILNILNKKIKSGYVHRKEDPGSKMTDHWGFAYFLI